MMTFFRNHSKLFIYLALISVIYFVWFMSISKLDMWDAVLKNWVISITMAIGSIVAGMTAEGGGAVSFPVFTKLLHIPVEEAKTFGLMIQTVGMGMASAVILLLGIKILRSVILCVSVGGALGVLVGLALINLGPVYPKILFSTISFCFGISLIASRWVLKVENYDESIDLSFQNVIFFFLLGTVGGMLVSQIGTGIDMLAFIVLVTVFGIHEKIVIPTTVIIMAINATFGFFIQWSFGGLSATVIHYWLAAVPCVIIGAPLGAYLAYKINRDALILILFFIIIIECISTVLIIPFTKVQTLFSFFVCMISASTLTLWVRRRVKQKAYAKL